MYSIIIFSMMFLLIPIILILINFILSKKSTNNREKKSPFECGFDPLSNSRIPFSIHFFLISLIFLIFDVEITLLIPMIIMFKKFNIIMILSISFFLMILLFGLYIEYSEQSIDWKM